jgi:hypothetical protein
VSGVGGGGFKKGMLMRHQQAIRLGTLATLVVTTGAVPALAQMSPVAVSGHLTGRTTIYSMSCNDESDVDTGELTAPPGFVPWNASLDVISTICPSGDVRITETSAVGSVLGPHEVRLSAASGFVVPLLPSVSQATARGTSSVSYTFRLREPTPFTLTGSAGTLGGPCIVQLTGPDGVIFDQLGESGPFSTGGELGPGEYTIWAYASLDFWCDNSGTPAHGEGGAELVFSMPPVACACDWNSNDGVGSDDFFAFLDSFFAGDADFNFDGVTDSQDFFDFLGCFFAPPGGCP